MQFKKGFKTVTAVALSVALAFAPAISSFAADETSQGVGNILAYNIDTVVVPTAIKLVINPNGYTINKKYVKVASDATHSTATKYYNKQSDGTFKEVKIAAEDWSTAKANAYTAVTSTDQVVSFNYGIASKATRDKTVTVRFDATADSGVEFVDDSAKITPLADPDDSTDLGAPQDSHRIFLNLVPAKATEAITAETKEKATAFEANTTYYKIADGEYVEDATITDATKFGDATYTLYKDSSTIGALIKASELADVSMTNSTAAINFAGENGKAAADVAYMLYHATYNVKEGEILDWDTSYDGIEDKFELTGIAQVSTQSGSEHNGGYSGFTFTGSMNTNTDWADLTTRTITIKPTYEFINATGSEEAVATGLNQVGAAERSAATVTSADPTISNVTTFTKANPADVVITFTLGSGDKAVDADGAVLYQGSSNTAVNTAKYSVNMSGKTITVDKSAGFMTGATANVPIKIDLTKNGTVVKSITGTIVIN